MIFSPSSAPDGERRDKAASDTAGTPATVPTVEVASIIGQGREAVILHNGERYRLRVTANDKLILTK